jgi:hypothetical protein
MSVIKRSKQSMANFRPPTSVQENETVENDQNPTENQSELRKKMIEDMAISMQQNRHTRKNPLDKHSTNVNISVSPRIKATWYHTAGLEGRNISDFVRRAVDFYIRKHGLG